MPGKRLNRKLAAILSADVKGFSRLMGEDEDFTVNTLTDYRKTMKKLIEKHRGRVVDSTGDNLLAEFASVVNAMRCAVEIQKALKKRNAGLPENRKMEFRIGINLGDVIEDGERIYGDGVNIAARVEGLAEAGGICTSRTVYEQVKNKLPLNYEYLGEQSVKNIAEPVKIYRVITDPEKAGAAIREKKVQSKHRRMAILAIAAVLFAGAAATVLWNLYMPRTGPVPEPAATKKITPPLTDKPSIAVLPFINLSRDPEQEYFSDGITNDIITDLSKFRELLIIASNTVFTYKGKPMKVKDLTKELNVRYVLEGSIQKIGGKVRINAQLIDAATESHLWAERFDRELKDLFAVQNEIVQTIVAKMAIKVDAAERARVLRKDTDNLAAYDYVLRGEEYLYRKTRSANINAEEMFKKAIELDPNYVTAYVGLGRKQADLVAYGWTEFPDKALQQAHDLAQKALSLDETHSGVHALLGNIYIYQGQHELAISELQRSIELNPNDAFSRRYLGMVMLWSGRPDDAIEAYETLLRYDPRTTPGTYMFLGLGYYLKGRYDMAISVAERGLVRHPDFVGNHIALAAAYAQAGRSEDAARAAEKVLKLDPFFEVEAYGTVFQNPADRAAIKQGLRKAGLK
jgi:adenylate cyclase